jgi:hypothetical protein
LDGKNVPVFFKGNLAWEPRREDFPVSEFVAPAVVKRERLAQKYGWPLNSHMAGLLA